jgi:hypothetical protein
MFQCFQSEEPYGPKGAIRNKLAFTRALPYKKNVFSYIMRTLALKIYIDSVKTTILEDANMSLVEKEHQLKSFPKFSSSEVPLWYFRQLRRGRIRKKRILKFEVDKHYLDQLFQNQNGRCALTGVLLWFTKASKNHQYQNASLDRIDSNLGYIRGNVQWVVKEVNMLKIDMTEKRFKNICLLVARNIFLDEEIKNLKTKEEIAIDKLKVLEQEKIRLARIAEQEKSRLACIAEQEKIRLSLITKEERLEDFFTFVGNSAKGDSIKIDKNQVICFHFPTYFEKWIKITKVADKKKPSYYRRELIAAIKTRPWFKSDSARRFGKNEDGSENVKRALTLIADDLAPEYIKDLYRVIEITFT